MNRVEITKKLNERTAVDPALLASLSDDRLLDCFNRSVSPALTRFQYNAGLGLIAAGSFWCASGEILLGLPTIYAALSIAESLDDKHGRNEAIRNEITAANPPEP